ncbi:MAG TPA: TIM barrel protein [Chloroflexota bacterium]|jgi:hydroxypyruvate isomerase|nr:TIM barrel protein [Chloroflexota bacterium]
MPRYAANLSMLWPALDVYDRFGAAAAAGFSRVEILFVHALDHDRVARLLAEHGLELVLFDPYPGEWDKGERGLLSLPGREAEFLSSIDDALAAALRFGTRRLNAIAGVLPPGVDRADAERTAVANLKVAAPRAEEAGVFLLVENINPTDMPGYVADTAARAATIVQAVNHPSVRLQLDQYHVGMVGGDARQAFATYRTLIEHVQIADVPGRHEPGTGQQPIAAFLEDLDAAGYQGSVGLEYRPSGDTDSALAWLPRDRRG